MTRYHVPKHIQKHIDYVTPGLRLLAVAKEKKSSSKPRKRGPYSKPTFNNGERPPKFNPIISNPIHPAVASQPLSNCNQLITPYCIRALYNVPIGTKAQSSNAMGIFEFGDAFAQQDLNMFYKNLFPTTPQGFAPKVQLIDGGKAPVPQSQAGVESSLDLEVAIPLLYPQGTVVYQLGTSGGFNTFLDAIDGVSMMWCDKCRWFADDFASLIAPTQHLGKLEMTVCRMLPTTIIQLTFTQVIWIRNIPIALIRVL